MTYIPHTEIDKKEMLSAIGVNSVEDLLKDIPLNLRQHKIELPQSISELELLKEIESFANNNHTSANTKPSFLGAGMYHHFIPAIVPQLAMRNEFYTAYTPYQPELSQGTLTAIFEFQTMICNLTGMDLANASMYDGASAAAEAAILACNCKRRQEIITINDINPQYKEVLGTYLSARSISIKENHIEKIDVTEKTAAVLIQNPNFFGDILNLKNIAEKVHAAGALLILIVDPISLGALKPPGEWGTDIAIGEGQSLGIPISFGGPGLGFFAAKKELQRFMPGRIVGETTDTAGKKGYVLTLQTREQHIRREKATSNICSNQALCALMATIYLSYIGPEGLKKLAQLNINLNAYAKKTLGTIKGFKVLNDGYTFKEFILQCPDSVKKINKYLLKNNIIGGLDLQQFDSKRKNQMLICTTELTVKNEINQLRVMLKKYKASS